VAWKEIGQLIFNIETGVVGSSPLHRRPPPNKGYFDIWFSLPYITYVDVYDTVPYHGGGRMK
jgi:hypothetical protein